jgi:hypothetical protein
LRILDPDVDTTSPAGELLAHITVSVAQWERRALDAGVPLRDGTPPAAPTPHHPPLRPGVRAR